MFSGNFGLGCLSLSLSLILFFLSESFSLFLFLSNSHSLVRFQIPYLTLFPKLSFVFALYQLPSFSSSLSFSVLLSLSVCGLFSYSCTLSSQFLLSFFLSLSLSPPPLPLGKVFPPNWIICIQWSFCVFKYALLFGSLSCS